MSNPVELLMLSMVADTLEAQLGVELATKDLPSEIKKPLIQAHENRIEALSALRDMLTGGPTSEEEAEDEDSDTATKVPAGFPENARKLPIDGVEELLDFIRNSFDTVGDMAQRFDDDALQAFTTLRELSVWFRNQGRTEIPIV